MSGMNCPNCGYHLEPYRTDRQPAGSRDALLEWEICPSCQHVAPVRWELSDNIEPEKLKRVEAGQRENIERIAVPRGKDTGKVTPPAVARGAPLR